MARPRTPIGTLGDISFVKATGGQLRARTRSRDDDGKVRRVTATGASKREAERNLKKALAERVSHCATGALTADIRLPGSSRCGWMTWIWRESSRPAHGHSTNAR